MCKEKTHKNAGFEFQKGIPGGFGGDLEGSWRNSYHPKIGKGVMHKKLGLH